MPSWIPWAASALVYAGLSALMGRDVIAGLGATVAPDEGDPVFTAGLMYWNATHVPLTEAWWQLPVFDPTRDTLAFSEHLLGLSVLSTPLYWLTRDPLATQNITMLLTGPLCGLAMYALVRRLTGSSGAAFLAGLAFAFAPYRAGQMSHVHVLAAFWAPLALLGLHAFLETGRRRWLTLYAGAWLLQVTTNAYTLVLLSVVVGLWVLWFVIARRRWRELAAISGATAVAFLPLVPILTTYVTVHERHGLTRTVGEMREFSAEILSVFCASDGLTLWGWLRVHCRPEAELFPGLAVLIFGSLAVWNVLRMRARGAPPAAERAPSPWRRAVAFVRPALLLIAGLYTGVMVRVLAYGPWEIDAGPLSASATTLEKPLLIAVGTLAAWLVLAPGLREAVRRSSTLGFYVIAALITWALALGPTIIVMGRPIAVDGPFALLLAVPGVGGLRVPARFWLMTLLCLVVASAIAGSAAFRGRSRRIGATAFLIVAAAVLADGWTRIAVAQAPRSAPAPHLLAGERVLELVPGDDVGDIASGYRAVTGGWRTLNGYSGYVPSYYPALADTFRAEEDSGFEWARHAGPVHVIAPREAPRLIALVERQPGAVLTGRNSWAAQYRLPMRREEPRPLQGRAVRIVTIESPCSPNELALALDGDMTTRWRCEREDAQEMIMDLGRVVEVGGLVHHLGRYSWEFPKRLQIETSVDGHDWRVARTGSVLREVIEGGLSNPRALAVALPFDWHVARYLRVRHRSFESGTGWTVAELEVRGRD